RRRLAETAAPGLRRSVHRLVRGAALVADLRPRRGGRPDSRHATTQPVPRLLRTHQYLPLVITCADNDQVVILSLRQGTAAASLGADDDLEYLVTRLRAVWPNVRIRVRGDGGFGNPTMYEVSERLEITYTYGLSTNAVLQRASEDLLAEAVRRWDETHEPQRLFAGFWYRAGTWTVPRWVVVKAEANAQGTNRRFVTTNRPGAMRYPEATYDEYALRGESGWCPLSI